MSDGGLGLALVGMATGLVIGTRVAGGPVDGFGARLILRLGVPLLSASAWTFCATPRAVSIHAYSPALWRLGPYTIDLEGALHRMSVSYADELRPLDAAARPAAA